MLRTIALSAALLLVPALAGAKRIPETKSQIATMINAKIHKTVYKASDVKIRTKLLQSPRVAGPTCVYFVKRSVTFKTPYDLAHGKSGHYGTAISTTTYRMGGDFTTISDLALKLKK